MTEPKIDNLNRPITGSEIEFIILKITPSNKSPGPNGFTGEFYKKLKKSSYLSFSNYSKNWRGRNTPKFIL